MYSVFNRSNNNALEEPMFLGNSVNVSRFDKQRYPFFEKLTEKQISFFWRPEEIDLAKDKIDFAQLTPHEQHIFISNLKYQTLLDSVQGRSPNVVLLPLTSLPELETWIETWAFYECVAEGTEVLTTKGWCDISEVTTKDRVLVYNNETEQVHFEKPKRTTSYDFKGKMVEYYSSVAGQFHQLVTPNHRMPVKTRVNESKHKPSRFFIEADFHDYKSHHLAPISGRRVLSKKQVQSLSAIDRLKIATQADGSLSSVYNGNRKGYTPIWFSFQKSRKVDRLLNICRDAKVRCIELSPAKDGQRRFRVMVPIKHKVHNWKNFSKCVDIKDKSATWCQQFLDEVSHWDGHKHISKKGDISYEYKSIIKDNTDVIQAIASICGYTARYKCYPDDRKETYKDIHYLNVLPRAFKDGQSINKRKVNYKGKVYCIETSTGAFVMRYKGVVSVTGNTIHSRSYTHILRNIFTEPSEVLDDIMVNKNILKRAEEVSKYYDDLYQYSLDYHKGEKVDLYTLKKKLYLCLMAVNALEGIRFYVSFACSFAFAERKMMEGNAKIIKMIARDEQLHLNGTQHILSLLAKEDPDFERIQTECIVEVYDMFFAVSQQEKDWVNYLFKDGSMLGMNEKMLCQYVDYITSVRMKAIGLEPFGGSHTNPFSWLNNWLSSDNVQVAPQETEISSYLVGQIDSNLLADDFTNFEL